MDDLLATVSAEMVEKVPFANDDPRILFRLQTQGVSGRETRNKQPLLHSETVLREMVMPTK